VTEITIIGTSEHHIRMGDYQALQRKVRVLLAKEPFCLRRIAKEDLDIFCEAFIHDSFSNEMDSDSRPKAVRSYERLEFLGDSIVEFLACEYIYSNSDLQEGRMTDFKQEIVANKKISSYVKEASIDIDGVLLLGHGHRDPKTKENIVEDNMRSDAFEALIAAIYLVHGMDMAREIVHKILILPALRDFQI